MIEKMLANPLNIDSQICFPMYAASRLIIKSYKPLLDTLGLTYPQYIVMLVLWERDNVSLKFISEKLLLESNTLTPLLKRMEANGLLNRERSKIDERLISIVLTEKGRALKIEAESIPYTMLEQLKCNGLEVEEAIQLKMLLHRFIEAYNKDENNL